MSAEVPNHFIKQYESELYHLVQNGGGFLRPRVRVKSGIVGSTADFPRIGIGATASAKDRHGLVPTMDFDRDVVTVTLYDRYGATWRDKLDDLKTNVDERAAVMKNITASLGRAEDDFILTALMSTSNSANSTSANDTFSTTAVYRGMLETFGKNEIFEAGQMHNVISWTAWAELLDLDEFVNADWDGNTELVKEGWQRPKMFYGFSVAPYSRLTLTSSKRTNLWFHKMCVALALAKDISTETAWNTERQAWWMGANMSMGAVLIDGTGVVKRQHNST